MEEDRIVVVESIGGKLMFAGIVMEEIFQARGQRQHWLELLLTAPREVAADLMRVKLMQGDQGKDFNG